jgi:hypothetical protein
MADIGNVSRHWERAMEALLELWGTAPPTSQAECVEAIKILTWCISSDMGLLRDRALRILAGLVLTPEDLSNMEQHRDDPRLPSLSPDSLGRGAALVGSFEELKLPLHVGKCWDYSDNLAHAQLLRSGMMSGALLQRGTTRVDLILLALLYQLTWWGKTQEALALLRTMTATARADELFDSMSVERLDYVMDCLARQVTSGDAEVRGETFRVLRNILVNCCDKHCKALVVSAAFQQVAASVAAGNGGEIVIAAALCRGFAAGTEDDERQPTPTAESCGWRREMVTEPVRRNDRIQSCCPEPTTRQGGSDMASV